MSIGRTIRGIAGTILLLVCSTANATLVAVEVASKNKDKEEFIQVGSGFVVGNIKDKSIVVTAGHLFHEDEEVISIKVFNVDAKLLYTKCTKNSVSASDEDISILEVPYLWKPKWQIDEEKANEYVKPTGWVDNVLITLNGIVSEKKRVIIECIVIPGQSGGPILAKRHGKDVVVGSIVGNLTATVELEDGTKSVKQIGFAAYNSGKLIRERLNKFSPGWENE